MQRGGRVVRAEVPHVVALPVGPHHRVVGEVVVAVDVDPDVTGGVVVEDPPRPVRPAVAVDVALEFLVGRGGGLAEHADREVGAGPVGQDPVVRAVRRGPALDPRDHGAPGAVALRERIGDRDPVGDLPLAGRRLLQARMVQVDARVEDPDRDAPAVVRRVVPLELHRPRVGRGEVGVDRRRGRRRPGPRVGGAGGRAPGALRVGGGVGDLQHLVEVDVLHLVDARDLEGLAGGQRRADVAGPVVGVAHGGAELLKLLHHGRRAPLGGQHHHRHLGLAGRLRLDEQLLAVAAHLVLGGGGVLAPFQRLGPGLDRRGQRGGVGVHGAQGTGRTGAEAGQRDGDPRGEGCGQAGLADVRHHGTSLSGEGAALPMGLKLVARRRCRALPSG